MPSNLYPYETDRSIEGKTILTRGTNVNIRSAAGTTGKILKTVAAAGTAIGKCSGRVWYDTNPSHKWYELDSNPPAYIRNDLATLTAGAAPTTASTQNSDAQAQKMLDEIVAQDKETMNNLNQAAGMIEVLKNKGVNTATSASKLTAIAARLQQRQDSLQKSTWTKVSGRISDGWTAVKKFFGFSGLGVVPIVVVAVVAIVAGAGGTALITLKPWKNQSTVDLKESRELKDLLDAADPVVAGKIREDLKSQVVDAYVTGSRQGSFSSIWNIGKYIAIGILGFILIPKLLDKAGK